MNEAEALRVLGLPQRSDVTMIRRAFAAQIRAFREAFEATEDPALRERLDRALKLTLDARNQLIMTETRSFATTQELPVIPTAPAPGGLTWRGRAALLMGGAGLLALGLLMPFDTPSGGAGATASVGRPGQVVAADDVRPSTPSAGSAADAGPATAASNADSAPDSLAAPPASTGDAGAVAEAAARSLPASIPRSIPLAMPAGAPQRSWLDSTRVVLARAWAGQDEGPPAGPTRIPTPAETAAAAGDIWYLKPQMHGAFALLASAARADDEASVDPTDAASRWLLAVPAQIDGALAWGCFTNIGVSAASAVIPGCLTLPVSALTDAVLAGRAGPFEIATALEAAGVSDGPGVGGWLEQAADRGDGQAAQRLAERIIEAAATTARGQRAADATISAAALAWYERADALFSAAHDARGRVVVMGAMARVAALDPTIAPESAARHMLACRDLRVDDAAMPPCPAPGLIGRALEAVAVADDDWNRARWWYQQAFTERERAGVEGLAQLHALGRTGPVDRERALSILEDAVRNHDDFGVAELALTAARIAAIWREGWGVAVDASEAIWWSAQAARRGHAEEAVQLAAGFALGAGTERDMERAREVVDLFGRVTPLFEVAFHRRVGERLAEGSGSAAEPDAARAWLRRAFERCRELADEGDRDAQLELAGMYLEGIGTEPDARRAAALYEGLVDHAPLKASNMLAWIRATHPDPALRDGTAALRHARALVAQAPRADYHDTLAAAFAETGDLEAARATQLQALALLDREADPILAGLDVADRRNRFSERLANFEQGRPWRDLP